MTHVLTTLTGVKVTDPKTIIDQGFNPKNQGCMIKAIEVHSICSGVVIDVGTDPIANTWCITVEVNSARWVRYCCLASYKVTVGQTVTEGTFLGYAYKGIMKLEYCTAEKSDYPVRLLSRQLYKHDPTPVIFGQNIAEVS